MRWIIGVAVLSLSLACGTLDQAKLDQLPEPSRPGDAELMVQPIGDPIEPINRTLHAFNSALFEGFAYPMVKGYQKATPDGLRHRARLFYNNLIYPLRFANNLLQGNVAGAGRETKRFLINSTLGIGGLGDPATHTFNIKPSPEDFDQTLGVWGWQPKMYLYLPVFGAGSERHVVGRVGDAFLDPATLIPPAKAGLTANEYTYQAKAFHNLLTREHDSYELTRLYYTILRDLQTHNRPIAGQPEATGQVQTLSVVFAVPEAAGFDERAAIREVSPEGFRRPLKYSAWIQPRPAPLAIVLPGLGGHRLNNLSVVFAEQAWNQGYSVVTLSSTFNWEFMRSAPAGFFPGHTPRDLTLLTQVIKAVQGDLAKQHGANHVQDTSLIGMSMGAWYTLNLAARDNSPFKKHIAVNPPIDLIQGLQTLDTLYRAPATDANATATITRGAMAKTLAIASQGTAPTMQLPFTDQEASYLIGLNFRLTLRQMIVAGMFEESLGISTRRHRLYERLNALSFADYFQKILTPNLEAQGVTAGQIRQAADLRGVEAGLVANQDVHVILSRNDFLLKPDQVDWFTTRLSNRHTVFDSGGHMGNLWQPDFKQAIRNALKR